MLLRQSPVKPKVGAGFGSENQKLVNAATFGAQNQWALPSSSTAHQRARFGALDQSIFMFQPCHVREMPANRFSFPSHCRSTPVVSRICSTSRKHVPDGQLQPLQNLLQLPQRDALGGVFEAEQS
jgi:hypothetical protein